MRPVVVLSFFYQCVFATRFLPMIVWDHLNPLLSCKCNWFPLPKIDVYDTVDFVCPSLKIGVKLLDGYSRPTSEMNENLFVRTWSGSEEDLKRRLQNGSFCDPTKAAKKYTCKKGQGDKSHGETFTTSQENGIVVFFNNGDDGKERTLSSTATKCTMVFAAKITWEENVKHDMSYGKCLNPKECDNINATCKSQCNAPKCSVSPTSARVYQGQLCTSLFSEKLKQADYIRILKTEATGAQKTSKHITSTNCTRNVAGPNLRAHSGKPSDFAAKEFVAGIALGFIVGGAVVGLYLMKRLHQEKYRRARASDIKKPAEHCQNPSDQPVETGFSHKRFSMESPTAPPAETFPEDNNEAPPEAECLPPCVICQKTLASVETKGMNSSTVTVLTTESGSYGNLGRRTSGALPPIQHVPRKTSVGTNFSVRGTPDAIDGGMAHSADSKSSSPVLEHSSPNREDLEKKKKRKRMKAKTTRG